jgi:outer membrane protein insertion porin family
MALAFALATPGGRARAGPPPAPPAAPAPPAVPAPADLSPGARALLAGEDPALGTTVPDLGEAPGPGLTGKPILRIDVVTVGDRWMTPLALVSVKPGEAASLEAARRLMREVLGTGQFARANVEAVIEGGGVVLRVNVLPRRLIASIQLGGSALDTAETLDAAEVSVGGELTATRLPEIAARVKRFYEQHGFPAATVRTDTAATDQADKVILSLEIVPGKPRTVSARVVQVGLLRGRELVVDPAAQREVGELASSYKVDRGARVDAPSLVEADKDLVETLRGRGFYRADVRHAVLNRDPFSYLYVYIVPGPRLVPAFEGNHAFDASDLLDALDLAKSPDARPAEMIERLRVFYVARGFLDAEVGMSETGKPTDPVHYLAFTLREHDQVRVVKRVFPCLSGALTPDELGGEIGGSLEEDLPGVAPFGPVDPRVVGKLFGPTAGMGGRGLPTDLNPLVTYAPDAYERAMKHVRDVLHAKGYLNAAVGPLGVVRASCSRRSPAGQCIPLPVRASLGTRCEKDALGLPVPEPPLPEAFTCRPDSARGVECSSELTLRIPVSLGPQTTLYDLAFEGNRSISSRDLGALAALPLGSPLSTVEVEAARLRVLDAYKLKGFAYASVRFEPELAPDRTRARLRFYVTERDRVIVTGFVVRGATRTSEALILRRVALRLNEPYQQDRARQTEERVATLGTFSSVSVTLEDADVPERRKRVVIAVVENGAQYLETRPGFSTGEGFRLTFEYGNRNLGGLAIGVTLRIALSYLPDPLILDPTVLQNLDTLGLAQRLQRRDTLSFRFPEIGLGPLVSLSLDALDVNDDQRDYRINKEAIVPTFTYRPFRQLTTQVGVSTELNDVSIFNPSAEADTSGLLRAPQGLTLALAERVGFTADYRDSPFNPTKGVLFSTSLEHVNAFPVASAGNPSTIQSHTLRLSGRLAGYVSRFGATLALSLGAGGNIQLFDGSATYPDRLFFMGGVDSHRAFLDSSMVPEDIAEKIVSGVTPIYPCTPGPAKSCLPTGQRALTIQEVTLRGGNLSINPRVELRVPLTGIFQAGLFLDMGNVWLDPTQLHFDSNFLRYGLGPGLRLATPIGPLAFDYGFNLNRRAWEDVGAFHFSIGLF